MATQASPGLNTPSAYQALPGLNPQVGLFVPNSNNQGGATTQAAVSAALLPANVMMSGPGDVGAQPLGGNQTPSLLAEMSEAGNNGTGTVTVGCPSANIGTPSNGGPGTGTNNGGVPQVTLNCPANALVLPGVVPQYCG
jgi:hypothetical protein